MKTGYDAHFKKIKKEMKVSSQKRPTFKVNKGVASQKTSPIPVRKKKKELPMTSLLGAICILMGALYGYINADSLEAKLDKVEISLFGQANAKVEKPTKEKNIPNNNKKEEKNSSEKSPEAKNNNLDLKNLTTEEVALFRNLEERKKQLDSREMELKALEEELHKQQEGLEKRIAELEKLREQIGNQLQERVSTDEERVDKLVAFYSTMKPQKAAQIIETLNEDLAVEILKKMKKKEAAEIMNMIKAEKAQVLSEKFTGYRRN